jgi:hypothetical protein
MISKRKEFTKGDLLSVIRRGALFGLGYLVLFTLEYFLKLDFGAYNLLLVPMIEGGIQALNKYNIKTTYK